MTTIKLGYFISGDPELEDKELPAILYNALGMTFHEFVERTLDKTRKAIKGRCGSRLYVRCCRRKEPKFGACFKTGGRGEGARDI